MNKTALKRFATTARLELLERIELQALKYGLTKEVIDKGEIVLSNDFFINGDPLTEDEKTQRNKLITRIKEIGFDRVIDEVAYTWFNRFTALRFMEVNDYIPTKVRVLSSRDGQSNEPEMIAEALTLDLNLDKEKIYDLKMKNETEALFKYLIIQHCNDLNKSMPFMFETINDYTELLFPDGLLSTDSFIREMTNVEIIPEENWMKVEIIGWLYQYYIADEKDRVFKAKKKYKAEEIPFATQLFTPDWIVQYMVQNSLGKKWIESHPEHKDLSQKWDFYIENQDENFEEKIAPYINKELNVEDIKCFDPAMGSGHILVYMFDVLHEIYSKCGYMEREIPKLIIENNLYGLDIDDRAYQLACFSVVMKALSYNRRFLRSVERHGIKLNFASIQETNSITDEHIAYLASAEQGERFIAVKAFMKQYAHAKSIGSLLILTDNDTEFLKERLEEIESAPVDDLFVVDMRDKMLSLLPSLIKQTEIMGQTYDVLVTNPPYMGSRSMGAELSNYLKVNYPDSKSDLFGAFIELDHFLKEHAFYAAINQHSWMFLSSFEKLRKRMIEEKSIDTMLHLGPRAFEEIGGEVVQSTAFVLRESKVGDNVGTYLRLIDYNTALEKKEKALEAVENPSVPYRYTTEQENFNKIPGSPIAYWVSEAIINNFANKNILGNSYKAIRGLETGNNTLFLKFWHEVAVEKVYLFSLDEKRDVTSYKWIPHNKGGGFRRWFGMNDLVVNFKNDGYEIRKTGTLNGYNYYLKEGITWSALTSGLNSFRYSQPGFLFDSNKGPMLFPEKKDKWIVLGMMNSKVIQVFLRILNPTLSVQNGNIDSLPFFETAELNQDIVMNINDKVKRNVQISKNDWDSFETSWDFQKHPLLMCEGGQVETRFEAWKELTEMKFLELQNNEEELNKIFIDIYGLQDELTPEVEDKDVTVRKADLERDIKSFLSYFIGCSFGRYSLDKEGLIYAGGEFDPSRYKIFAADEDNIIPILDEPYFEDDIVKRFEEFLTVTFSADTLEENLDFIADALVRRKNETARETIRRYLMNDFYKNHTQIYKKRPIYGLFTSGKEKAFNCLVYMHRYDKTTLSRIRTDYLHETQSRYDVQRQDLINMIEGDYTTKEINAAKKQLTSLDKKIAELKAYDEVLHHMADMQIEIDLDDGVAVNYAKFKGLVAKI